MKYKDARQELMKLFGIGPKVIAIFLVNKLGLCSAVNNPVTEMMMMISSSS